MIYYNDNWTFMNNSGWNLEEKQSLDMCSSVAPVNKFQGTIKRKHCNTVKARVMISVFKFCDFTKGSNQSNISSHMSRYLLWNVSYFHRFWYVCMVFYLYIGFICVSFSYIIIIWCVKKNSNFHHSNSRTSLVTFLIYSMDSFYSRKNLTS